MLIQITLILTRSFYCCTKERTCNVYSYQSSHYEVCMVCIMRQTLDEWLNVIGSEKRSQMLNSSEYVE